MQVIDVQHTAISEWTAAFIGLSSLISAIGAAYAAIQSARNSTKIQEVHDATNGMKAELVKSTGDLRYAEGRIHGEDFPRRAVVKKRRSSKPKVKKKNG